MLVVLGQLLLKHASSLMILRGHLGVRHLCSDASLLLYKDVGRCGPEPGDGSFLDIAKA